MLESMPTGSNEIEAGICSGVLWKCFSRKVVIGWQHCLLFSWSLKPGVLTTVRCNFTPCFEDDFMTVKGDCFLEERQKFLSAVSVRSEHGVDKGRLPEGRLCNNYEAESQTLFEILLYSCEGSEENSTSPVGICTHKSLATGDGERIQGQ